MVDPESRVACDSLMSSYGPRVSSLFRYVVLAGACCTILALLGGVSTASRYQPASGDRPAAVLDSQGIGWPEIAPLLAEAAGAGILEEVILERGLEKKCREQSITIGESAIRYEEDLLVSSLARAAQVPVSEGDRLVREVRINRGLGERRYAGLLKRNAMLRALARKEAGPDGVQVSADDIAQAFELRYGPKVRAKMILVRTQEQAADAAHRLSAGEDFSDVATKVSADPSRLRGGMLDPISPADPSYPVAFRRALDEIAPDQVSAPVMVMWDAQPGFAIIRVEERIPGAGVDLGSVAAELASEVQSVRERGRMDRLARSIIDAEAARLSVLDESIEWSWRNRRDAGR